MKVRAAQLAAFRETGQPWQIDRMEAILRRSLPSALSDWPAKIVRSRIAYACRAGSDFLGDEIGSEAGKKALMLWVRLMFEATPDFMHHPAVRRVLESPAEPRSTRVARLLHQQSAVPWASLVRGPAEQNWPEPSP